MRFIHELKTDNKPAVGDHRYKSGFLFFPKRILNETRWLEFAKWKEEYWLYVSSPNKYKWVGTRWE